MVAWRSTAEFVSKYFTKGRMAVVEGRLQIRDWTDKDGGKRRSAEVVADNVYFGDSKRDGAGDFGGAPRFLQRPQWAAAAPRRWADNPTSPRSARRTANCRSDF